MKHEMEGQTLLGLCVLFAQHLHLLLRFLQGDLRLVMAMLETLVCLLGSVELRCMRRPKLLQLGCTAGVDLGQLSCVRK